MASPASVAKHPIHPMLVTLPIGLWVFSLFSDIVYYLGGGPVWMDVAFWTMAGGIAGALLAAIPGFIDYRTLTGRPGRVATYHMSLNLSLVVLFAINLWLRANGNVYVILSVLGVVGLGVSGWLGGELVYVHGIAVEPQAVSAPQTEREELFDEYWSAYNYSLHKARERQYDGRDWTDVEEDFRKDWDREHPGSWGRFRDTIRRGWEARH